MANRTVKIIGLGFGSTSAQVVATANGSSVYSGAIDTVDQPLPNLPNDVVPLESLFTFEIPMSFDGTVPMTITVSGAPVIFGPILANYANVGNVVNGQTGFVSSGANGFIEINNPWPMVYGEVKDSRANVVIDGVAQTITPEERGPLTGTWWWTIQPGSVFEFDVVVTPGLE